MKSNMRYNPFARTVVPNGDISELAVGDVFDFGEVVPAPQAPAPVAAVPSTMVGAVKRQNVPIIAVENGHVQSSPFGGDAFMQYAELEENIQFLMAQTPAEPVITTTPEVAGVAATTINLAAVQAPAGNTTLLKLYYPFIIIQFSASQFNQLPAGVISIAINAASDFRAAVNILNLQIAVHDVTKRVVVKVVPAFVIQAAPRPLLGVIDGTPKNLVVTSSGLATGTNQTVIIPGSTHQSIPGLLSEGR